MNNSFSKEEWEFLTQASPMHLKPSIQEKIDLKLSFVKHELTRVVDKYRMNFPAWGDDLHLASKIYRGENYLGMPWMALDFPKNYGKDSSLAFRVLVLWGDAIYTSLLAEENVKIEHLDSVSITNLPDSISYIINENRWIQTIESDSCRYAQNLDSILEHRKQFGFTRLFQKIEFSKWNTLESECSQSFINQCEILLLLKKMRPSV
jgi:hypothetical protein